MFEIKGEYSSAKIFNDYVEETAMSQIYQLVNNEMSKHAKIRIMPDVHAGAGCVIGLTSTLTNKTVPNIIGVDIGCSVCGWNLGKIDIDFEALDRHIRELIPNGRGVHEDLKELTIFSTLANYRKSINMEHKDFVEKIAEICKRQKQDLNRVMRSLGSLGGGNHFIEIDEDDEGNKWLVIHSGSRNFGLKVANWHQKKANDIMGKRGGLAYLEGNNALNYFDDMKVAQKYAKINRRVMGRIIVEGFFKTKYFEPVESVHNYINFEDKIVRKGAISAHKDEKVLIPLNMKDGTIIGTGKGIEDWNYSAPHGAGRVMSRTKAKELIPLEHFENIMKGVWTSCVSKGTLDESPFAYKKAKDIIKYLEPVIDIECHMKSVYNFKAN